MLGPHDISPAWSPALRGEIHRLQNSMDDEGSPIIPNALLFSSEELTHPEVIKLDSNGTFVKFVDLSAKMLRAFSSVNSYVDFYGGTQTFLFYYEKR